MSINKHDLRWKTVRKWIIVSTVQGLQRRTDNQKEGGGAWYKHKQSVHHWADMLWMCLCYEKSSSGEQTDVVCLNLSKISNNPPQEKNNL